MKLILKKEEKRTIIEIDSLNKSKRKGIEMEDIKTDEDAKTYLLKLFHRIKDNTVSPEEAFIEMEAAFSREETGA